MGTTKGLQELAFDAFIKCIGFPPDQWNYSEDAYAVFWIASYGITMGEPEEVVAPPVREDAEPAPLQAHVQALLDSYEGMEYEITNVQDSLGDKYGKVIIQFKKKEEA